MCERAGFSPSAPGEALEGHLRKRARRPFGGPEHVIKYLARYTHRVAISNGRLISLQDGAVTFRWRDSADGSRQKLMTIDAVEFIRRFLLHVLPRGFVKIRLSVIKMPLKQKGQAATHGISLPGDARQPYKIGLMVTRTVMHKAIFADI